MADEVNFNIRRATKEDIPDLIEMRQKLIQHMEKNNKNLWGMSRDFISNLAPYYEQQIANSEACLLVACEEETGNLIGMALGQVKRQEEYLPELSGRIDDVWVEPSSRRHGICEVMFSEMIGFFREHRVKNLVIEYAIYNKEAELTWSRLGFRPSLIISTATIDEVKEIPSEKYQAAQ